MNLKAIAQESKQLTNHVLPSGLTPLERGLEQIESQSKRVLRRTTARQDSPTKNQTVDNRTAYLLASRGIDTDKVLENMVGINLALSFEPLQGVPDTGIEAYLQNEHETLVSLAIEETKIKTSTDFETHFEDSIQRDWLKQKRRILENLGHQSLGSQIDVDHVFDITDKEKLINYQSVVKEINNCRLAQKSFDPVIAFKQALSKLSADKEHYFIPNCWGLLSKMIQAASEKGSRTNLLAFSKIHNQANSNETNPEVVRLNSKLVEGARFWLEDNFRSWVGEQVRENRYQIGGLPTVDAEVDAYINVKFFKDGRSKYPWIETSIGNTPFWVHVYLLVRMGLRKEALKYAEKYSKELAQSKDNKFLSVLKEWVESADGRLSKATRDALLNEWNLRVRDFVTSSKLTPKGDAFKYTLYKLIGRYDLSVKVIRNNEVIQTMDDWLWVHTMLISENVKSKEPLNEKYTLRDFSAEIQKQRSYFPKIDTWFMALLLSGEFEKAVSELYREPFFRLDAIHFSIALSYYGLLRVPEDPKSIPINNTVLSAKRIKLGAAEYDCYSFHFARVILRFVKNHININPEMIHYVFLVGIYGRSLGSQSKSNDNQQVVQMEKDYTNEVYTIIRDIITQIDSKKELLGEVSLTTPGNRKPGLVEKFKQLIHLHTEQEYLDYIILKAADKCVESAKIKDALELYHLGREPNKVLILLIREIGESLLSRTNDVSMGQSSSIFPNQDYISSATQVMDFYSSYPQTVSQISPHNMATCRILVALSKFRSCISSQEYDEALNIFTSLDIVPNTTDMTLNQNKATAFNNFDTTVCRVMPSIFVEVVSTLAKLYQKTAHSNGQDREQRMFELKERANAILSFCGLIQYHIPGDMFAKMNRTCVMMG
ncbi:hypothetical protein HDV02_003240 [Globomyces sp. JEL0801]|nr:hypothetical protein HDV02_003240 [Globomyces sp. JEL0801]